MADLLGNLAHGPRVLREHQCGAAALHAHFPKHVEILPPVRPVGGVSE